MGFSPGKHAPGLGISAALCDLGHRRLTARPLAVTDANNAPPPPATLPCEMQGELGSGATGSVWRATLTAPLGELPAGTSVAIKRMHAHTAKDPGQRAAFEREAQVARDVHAPGVVGGLASGEDDAGPWLVLQWLPGLTLREQLLYHGALPEPQVRAVAERIVGALLALRNAGYLHGDLKPENVRLDGEGRAVLLDLGFLAPVAKDGDPAASTKRQPITGSLPYLAPESLRGCPAGEASEVFSLGILLFELATNTHPFATSQQLSQADGLPGVLLGTPFELPSLRTPTLSPFLDRLLEVMLAPHHSNRPSLDDLHNIVREEESGLWWRDQLDHSGRPRTRSGTGSTSTIPLVGREEELAQLLAAARRLVFAAPEREDSGGSVLRLEGPRGSGKSRLIREFARRIRLTESPPIYLQGRCSRFEESRPCQPILTLLSGYVGLPGGMPPGGREREKLEQLLPSAESEALLLALDPSFDGTTSSSVPAALCAWLIALAEESPVVIYLDDLEFADEGTLEILGRLVRHVEHTRLLMILGFDGDNAPRRPAAQRLLVERLERLHNYKTLQLAPLSQEAVRSLVAALFTNSTPLLRLAKVLWERSRGNPALIAELLRRLHDNGDTQPSPDGLVLRIHPDDLPLPSSLREEIAQSFARLDTRTRLWLSRLAVTGGRIQTRFLLRAWPQESASDLDATLAHLTQVGWLRPEGDRYRFRRPALRAAIYNRLAPSRRKELHTAVARALRPGPGGKLSLTDAFQRVYHLRSAGQYRELLQLLRPLLQRVADRGQPARVHTLGLWGLEALAALPQESDHIQQAMEFLWSAADAADRLGYREKQRLLLDQLADLDVDPDEHPEQAGRTFLLHARYAISTGQFGNARGMLFNAIRCFESAGNKALFSDALRRQAAVHAHVGEFGPARKLARRARESAPDDFLRARVEHTLGVLDMLDGKFEGSLRHSDQCLMLLRNSELFETLTVRALAHALRARVYRGAGRPRRGLVSAQHAMRFAQRAGDRRLEIELQARLGVHMLDIDRVDEAERLLRDAILMAKEIEDRRSESIATLFLGILLAEKEDPSATIFFARCITVSRAIGNARTEAICTSMQARMAYAADPASALPLSTHAMELLDRAGAELIDRIVITGTHVMVLEATGHSSRADNLLETLRRRMRAVSSGIESPLLQRRQRLATTQLLRAALTDEGPVYRRVSLDGAD